MGWFDQLAEARITEAIERGELDNLPGAGKPLQLDDDTLVPEELRMAYRILKNAGYLPPELELRQEARVLERSLGEIDNLAERLRASKRLSCLLTCLDATRPQPTSLLLEPPYYEKLVQRFARA